MQEIVIDGIKYNIFVKVENSGKLEFFIKEPEEFVNKEKNESNKFSNITNKDFFLEAINLKKLADNTKEQYINVYKNHFSNHKIAKLKLKDTTDLDMFIYFEELKSKINPRTGTYYSNKSIKDYYTVIKAVFNLAVKLELIDNNRLNKVEINTKDKKLTDNYWNEDSINELFKLLTKEPLVDRVAFILLLVLGLRRGELKALEFTDFDMRNNTVKISKSLSQVPGKRTIKTTKEVDQKVIKYPEFLNHLLIEHYKDELIKKYNAGNNWYYKGDENYLFTRRNGEIMGLQTMNRRLNRFIEKNGLKKITLHGLRHTNVYYLLKHKISIEEIARRLGHKSSKTTVNYYSHMSSLLNDEAADVFEKECKDKIII